MNHANIETTLAFLSELTTYRLKEHFGTSHPAPSIPVFQEDDHPFTRLILDHQLNVDEYVAVSVAMAGHWQPDFFDRLVSAHLPAGQADFKPIGGYRSANIRTFQPTLETVVFILAGNDLARRIQVLSMFRQEHLFARHHLLHAEEASPGEPFSSGRLIMDPEWVERILFGDVSRPRFSSAFPAELVQTDMDWEDLVLAPATQSEIHKLMTWLMHGQTLFNLHGMKKRLKPGYRALFHGPPGTGKTLTAGLLGKLSGREVYKVDLSMVVSKYIGETEKNLSNLFDRAQNKNWILFFDEADALFSKRTNVRDAHDKYANQEVSYLLQRVENYNGLAILASNFKSNLDEAFIRRFQSVIHFPMPGPGERFSLWKKALPSGFEVEENLLEPLAHKYELSGASILNIIQYAGLTALERNETKLIEKDLLTGIQKEFSKDGKMMP